MNKELSSVFILPMGQKSFKIFVRYLEDLKTPKFLSFFEKGVRVKV